MAGISTVYFIVLYRFLKTTTELKRLYDKTMDDIKKNLKQTLFGGSYIRISNRENYFNMYFNRFMDKLVSIDLHIKFAQAHSVFTFDLLGGVIITFFTILLGCSKYAKINLTNDYSLITFCLAWTFGIIVNNLSNYVLLSED